MKTALILGLAGLLAAGEAPNSAQPLSMPHADFVVGAGAGSRINSNEGWRAKRKKNLEVHHVAFFEPLNQARTLKSIQRSDIFYFSGHAGISKKDGAHFLQVLGDAPKSRERLTAEEIRTALGGQGPRLVVINACKSDAGEDVPEPETLAAAFGLSAGSKNRAFLGWPTNVVGIFGDDKLGWVFDAWTTMRDDGLYPTLAEARKKAGVNDLVIIGDAQLRYKTPYVLQGADAKTKVDRPLRLYLDPKTPTTATALLDLSEKSVAEYREYGCNRFYKMPAVWDKDAYVVKDETFRRLVEKVCQGLAGASDPDTKVNLLELYLRVQPTPPTLAITVRVHVTATVTKAGVVQSHDVLRDQFPLVGKR